MIYSFIKPNIKRVVQYDTRIWWGFILSMSTIMLIFNFFIQTKYEQIELEIKNNKEMQNNALANIKDLQNKIEYFEKQVIVYDDIYINNNIFADSIKNLFALIPDQIILESVTVRENDLLIKGKTPTKDVYNYLLKTPLKSIFSSSEVNFYLGKDNWYSFLSVNRFDKAQTEEAGNQNEQ